MKRMNFHIFLYMKNLVIQNLLKLSFYKSLNHWKAESITAEEFSLLSLQQMQILKQNQMQIFIVLMMMIFSLNFSPKSDI